MEFNLNNFCPSQVFTFLQRYASPPSLHTLCAVVVALVTRAIALVVVGVFVSFMLWGGVHCILFEIWGTPYPDGDVGLILQVFGRFLFVLVCIVAGTGATLLCVYGVGWLQSKIENIKSTKPKNPSVIKEAYRGWKDKYCPTVRWVHK